MILKNKTVALRRMLSVGIGWLHGTLVFSSLYALVLNVIHLDLSREAVIRNYLYGLLFIIPIALSWFAKRWLRSVFLYLIASAAIVALTVLLFGNAFLAAPAILLCFLRLHNRVTGETRSLIDHAAYPALLLILLPGVCSIFYDVLSGVFQSASLLCAAIYFLLCFIQHGIERIDNYIEINKDMQNMPKQRIIRIASATLGAIFVIFAAILLPPLIGNSAEYHFVLPESTGQEAALSTPDANPESMESEEEMEPWLPEVESNPVMTFIWSILEYIVLTAAAVGLILAAVYGVMWLSRNFRISFRDRGDFIENLSSADRLETIREKGKKRDKPGFFDRSPNAVVRRKYRRTILHAAKEPPACWMTPSEAEAHARLSGPSAARLHNLYEKARYSADGCTRADITEI